MKSGDFFPCEHILFDLVLDGWLQFIDFSCAF